MRTASAACLVAVVAGMLGGCAERMPQAAMVAASPDGGYGYSDRRLTLDHYDVNYLSPELSLPADEVARARRLDAEKARAFDLALWRSTQIAAAQGFTYLKVEEDHRDATVDVKRQYAPAPTLGYSFYGPGGALDPPWWLYSRPSMLALFWFYQDPFASQQYSVVVSGRVSASLKVALAKMPQPGFEDAVALGQRLSRQYAGTAYP